MEAYIAALKAALAEFSAAPLSMRNVEQAEAIAALLCRLYELDAQSPDMRSGHGFGRADADSWAAKMQNADGTTGPHWTVGQCVDVANALGIDLQGIPDYVFWVAMCMAYSDQYTVARDYGIDQPQYYARVAESFLRDKDAAGPVPKIAAYYACIAK